MEPGEDFADDFDALYSSTPNVIDTCSESAVSSVIQSSGSTSIEDSGEVLNRLICGCVNYHLHLQDTMRTSSSILLA